MEIAGQNVLFWTGSIKRLDFQTTYRYRAETFRFYSYRLGPLSCVDTRSDLMRVSQSGMSNVKIPEILQICWPASEPCREATSKYSGSIIPVPILRIHTYPPCNWEGIDMRSLVTVACQSWVKYRWNLVIAWQKVLFWRGSVKRLVLQTTYRYRAERYRVEPFRIYFYRIGLPYCVVTRSDHMRVSHSRTSKLKILEIFKHFFTCIGAL